MLSHFGVIYLTKDEHLGEIVSKRLPCNEGSNLHYLIMNKPMESQETHLSAPTLRTASTNSTLTHTSPFLNPFSIARGIRSLSSCRRFATALDTLFDIVWINLRSVTSISYHMIAQLVDVLGDSIDYEIVRQKEHWPRFQANTAVHLLWCVKVSDLESV